MLWFPHTPTRFTLTARAQTIPIHGRTCPQQAHTALKVAQDFLWKSLKLRPGFVNQVTDRIETDKSINQVEKQLECCLSAAPYLSGPQRCSDGQVLGVLS